MSTNFQTCDYVKEGKVKEISRPQFLQIIVKSNYVRDVQIDNFNDESIYPTFDKSGQSKVLLKKYKKIAKPLKM